MPPGGRPAFFHNGRFRTLEEVVRFYAERDANPRRWYPVVRGAPAPFDDLPRRYRGNIERNAPFGGEAGAPPPLDKAEIAAIVAFLRALTDADAEATPPTSSRPRSAVTPPAPPPPSAAQASRP